MIGIIGAMEIEIETLKVLMKIEKKEKISGIEYVCGELCGKNAVLAVCGPGKVNAAACAEAMILKFNPQLIINTGVGGTLSNELKIGDVAVSSAVVEHDMDTSALGEPKGLIPGINMIEMKADKESVLKMEKALEEVGINYRVGVVASGDQFINSSEKKKFITEEFGGICCEMEGASIGHVCVLNEMPFIVLRAISDGADENSHMNYPEFCALAAENTAKVMQEFLKSV